MVEDPFSNCWFRWERANEHRMEMVSVWNAYIDQHPHDVQLHHQGQGVYVVRITETEPFPSKFAGLFGEWINNLRASLDYIIWATSTYVSGRIPPPNSGTLQYPIYDDEATWKKNLYRIKNLPNHQQTQLKQMQPFAGDLDKNYLGLINRLGRIDRHRTLVSGSGYLTEFKPAFGIDPKPKKQPTLQFGSRIVRGPFTDVARIEISPWDESTTVKFNPRATIDPEIYEWSSSPFWSSVPFGQRLRIVQEFVAGEIAMYEYDCKGSSRRESLLTDNFRNECDSRERSKTPERVSVENDAWGEPKTPTPTTLERINADVASMQQLPKPD